MTLGLNGTEGIKGDPGPKGSKGEMGSQGSNGGSGRKGNHTIISSKCCCICFGDKGQKGDRGISREPKGLLIGNYYNLIYIVTVDILCSYSMRHFIYVATPWPVWCSHEAIQANVKVNNKDTII